MARKSDDEGPPWSDRGDHEPIGTRVSRPANGKRRVTHFATPATTTDAPLVVAVILCPGHNTRSFTSAPTGPEPGKRFPTTVSVFRTYPVTIRPATPKARAMVSIGLWSPRPTPSSGFVRRDKSVSNRPQSYLPPSTWPTAP
jgi:hypothetical protein